MEVYNNVKDILRQRIIMSTIHQKCLSFFTTKDVYIYTVSLLFLPYP